MSSGVFAILGQKDFSSADIVRSFSNTFHMPFVTSSRGAPSALNAFSYEIHVRPDNTAAIVDIIKHFGWRHIYYLYDSDDGELQNSCLATINFRLP